MDTTILAAIIFLGIGVVIGAIITYSVMQKKIQEKHDEAHHWYDRFIEANSKKFKEIVNEQKESI